MCGRLAEKIPKQIGCFSTASTLPVPQSEQQSVPVASAGGGGMAHMAGHMYLTSLRPIKLGDKAKADAVVAAAREAMAPYQDYRKALADGYRIFFPSTPQPSITLRIMKTDARHKPTSIRSSRRHCSTGKRRMEGTSSLERCIPIALTPMKTSSTTGFP